MCRHVPLLGIAACFLGCATSLVAPTDPGHETKATARPAASVANDATVSSEDLAPDSPHAIDPFQVLQLQFEASKARSRQQGTASYYADSLAGNKMANGEVYDPRQPTMAHRTLPFGTVVRVTRVSTNAQVVLRVTDRGPFGKKRRIADLSKEAARRLGMLKEGVVEVRLEVLGQTDPRQR